MAEKRIVIGLTGPISGGKGTVAEILKSKGFFYTSTSDRIREEISARHEEITREKLLKVADELRQSFGPEVLAKRSWEMVENKEENVVIDSIRGEVEVDFLKTKPGFILIGVTAPRELRFERAKQRVREGEPLVWENFVEIDKNDFDSGLGKNGRNIQACLQKADFLIENTKTLDELKLEVDKILEKILN
jgi:dephospho-CoA kinase